MQVRAFEKYIPLIIIFTNPYLYLNRAWLSDNCKVQTRKCIYTMLEMFYIKFTSKKTSTNKMFMLCFT